MKKLVSLLIVLFFVAVSLQAKEWKARWITSDQCQSRTNSWLCFQKTVELPAMDGTPVYADIAVDSKYWMWINGEMVVFEGGLKRGPNPRDTYYDHVDITPYLTEGKNSIAILMWYFGKDGFSHSSSGKAGLLFDCQTEKFEILSDASWGCQYYGAYEPTTEGTQPNWRLPESNIRFNAQKEIVGWMEKGANPRFGRAFIIGDAGISPWNKLVERPIPLWKDYGIRDYISIERKEGAEVDTFYCKLPYNCHATPYLDVVSPAGKVSISKPIITWVEASRTYVRNTSPRKVRKLTNRWDG